MALLNCKIVAITGSSRGIGKAAALKCAEQGAAGMVLHYYGDEATSEEVLSLEDEITKKYRCDIVSVPGDIADPATSTNIVTRGVEKFGRIDVLVSNAGICPFYDFLSMPREVWARTMAVNLDGSFYVVQAVANQMKSQNPQGGSIIQISSWSAYGGGEFQAHYGPTKAGVLSLMQSCAVALGKYGIRCNAILPGTISTEINKEDLANPEKRAYMEKRISLGRLGNPDDVAGPIVFMASDLARYVTGSALLVDGGLFVNLQ
ncbi:NAD(P)-binding protein [Sistotremastrum niveocremeum HHB9708]|uniref:NAD(P)-binding protein n=1 Tax=Sistotremastrum niveocremeum HHB9708 TaxID=1314777 RepID=A0A164XI25_9AGAM|nr:NAD(P)-binding protein [Sistotremastrum niveocremeum HHB9708]